MLIMKECRGWSWIVQSGSFQIQPFAALQHREGWSKVQGKTCQGLQHGLNNRAEQHLHQSGPAPRPARRFWLPSLAKLQLRLSLSSSFSR
jgi:hypothetical protein